jgi:hypothetical protein
MFLSPLKTSLGLCHQRFWKLQTFGYFMHESRVVWCASFDLFHYCTSRYQCLWTFHRSGPNRPCLHLRQSGASIHTLQSPLVEELKLLAWRNINSLGKDGTDGRLIVDGQREREREPKTTPVCLHPPQSMKWVGDFTQVATSSPSGSRDTR